MQQQEARVRSLYAVEVQFFFKYFEVGVASIGRPSVHLKAEELQDFRIAWHAQPHYCGILVILSTRYTVSFRISYFPFPSLF